MRVTKPMFDAIADRPVCQKRAAKSNCLAFARERCAARVRALLAAGLLVDLAFGPVLRGQQPLAPDPSSYQPQSSQQPQQLPPRVVAAQRFLAQRGVAAGHRAQVRLHSLHRLAAATARPMTASAQNSSGGAATATWQPLGPAAVITPNFGLVTGRISAIALDPSDPTGNHVYIGTTGGGVWSSGNAGTSTLFNIVFNPLTDTLTALGGATDASISIGALTVQPGGTGVILAGTGDPNDVLDSYYGAGILRSTDGGNTWSLIERTSDAEDNLANRDVYFTGEGFAGFAWSAVSPQLVVAAVTQSYEGDLVDANLPTLNCQGLFYSTDSGATWHLATITDTSGEVVQSPGAPLLGPDGNAATSVVWNPVRQLFVAAVRYHGYYQSSDGITWTRLADQPGTGLTTVLCPTNPGIPGDVACPIYRGALAVNPQSGDTFAWTVDANNQDQGLWQDKCSISAGACTNSTITFARQWSTAALETSTILGAVTIADGNYNLALAAVPSSQDTLVLAGANDLWKCSLAMGCIWRNTTNTTTCMSAQVGEFQHALGWNTANPQEIFVGNDSGLWRSTDAIGETGSACSPTDSTHFQNLNGSLGSLAEVVGLSPVVNSSYTIMAGLGVNGVAGVKGSGVTTDWPQILSGFGGPVAIDPTDVKNWYVNDQPGVTIYLCSQAAPCTPSAFGTTPAVTDPDVGGDGDAMPLPAPFLVDPVDNTQLLIGTCRVWRGTPGSTWTSANAISPILSGGASATACNGNALIRSMAAMPLASGGEIIYLGMYGSLISGSLLPGHVLSAVYNPSISSTPTWSDLTLDPVINSAHALNYYNLDISSITVDTHDTTGNTVYVTVEGMPNETEEIETVYRSTNGGTTWTNITSNLPLAPASSMAIDPQSANTVYVATDAGVYFTPEVGNCGQSAADCWSAFGIGLPAAPAVTLSAAPATASTPVLVAATYGRGIWQTPLWSAGTALTAASANPAWLTFSSQGFNSSSSPMPVTLLNTGSLALAPTSVAVTGDFSETDNCVNQSIAPGASCTIKVTFTPQAPGPLTGEMTIYANVYGGQLTVDLNGAGTASGAVTLTPANENFSQIEEGTVSAPLSVSVANSGAAVPISSVTVTAPFTIPANGNSCGTTSLAANSDCAIQIEFAPTTAGAFTGLLTLTDGAGTQTVQLNGTAVNPPTDILNPSSLVFPATPEGQLASALPVTITNMGGMPLTSISVSISGEFQQSNNCSTQLAAGAVCTISVVFAPTQLGALSGTLTISDALKTQSVSLSGTGVAPPVFNVTPASLAFTNQQPGVASAPQTLTIANAGASPMANISFAITGAAAANYSVASTTCGTVLSNGSSCTAQIVFTPSAIGAIGATLVVSSSTVNVSPVSVPLNGSGQLTSGLATNPGQLSFPVIAAGQSSTAQSITVTNSSSYAIGSIALSASVPFKVSQNGCTAGLAAGANCTALVVFAPTLGGAATGSLTITSTAVATPATVALSGTGYDFTVAISGPSSQTVARGQQANYTLVLTPAGSSGTFTFACGTLPTDALCLFNPTTQTLNAGVQGNVLVEISTSSALVRLQRPQFGSPVPAGQGPPRPAFWRVLPLSCGLLLLPLAIRRRRKIFQLVVLLAVLACGVSSCTSSGGGTGGTGGNGGSGGTPTGTYTIPVTVTSVGISQSVNVTLTVD